MIQEIEYQEKEYIKTQIFTMHGFKNIGINKNGFLAAAVKLNTNGELTK